jgi:hypothetical protein
MFGKAVHNFSIKFHFSGMRNIVLAFGYHVLCERYSEVTSSEKLTKQAMRTKVVV